MIDHYKIVTTFIPQANVQKVEATFYYKWPDGHILPSLFETISSPYIIYVGRPNWFERLKGFTWIGKVKRAKVNVAGKAERRMEQENAGYRAASIFEKLL